jgi:hypothetical protein
MKFINNKYLCDVQTNTINIASTVKFSNIILPRSGGKTLLAMIIALRYAQKFNGMPVVVTSPIFRQAKMVFRELEKAYMILNYDEPYDARFKPYRISINKDMCCVTLRKTNSSILMLPIEEALKANRIFGWFIIDEAQGLDDRYVDRFLSLIDKKSLICNASIFSCGYYDDVALAKISLDERFCVSSFGYKSYPKEFFNKDIIEDARSTLGKDYFNMEYNSKIVRRLDDTEG